MDNITVLYAFGETLMYCVDPKVLMSKIITVKVYTEFAKSPISVDMSKYILYMYLSVTFLLYHSSEL